MCGTLKNLRFLKAYNDYKKLRYGHVESAFTLIEIIIVISLIAFVYAIAMPNLGMMGANEVAVKLGRLNSDIRSAYDLAVLSGKSYRMVFELKSGDYWLEETETPDVKLGDEKTPGDPTEDEILEKKSMFDETFEEYEELAGEEVTNPESDKKIAPESPVLLAKEKLQGPEWTKVDSLEWKKRSLGDGLIIKDMQAEHHQRKVSLEVDGESARGFIYFLPNGYVEDAYLHIYYTDNDGGINEDKEPYTIKTSPWEGVGTIIDGYEEIDLSSD
ncbi:MAG: hypothetical protein R3B45_01410 [Bdellovibrionota bacterium]